jgi:hypothetical protein
MKKVLFFWLITISCFSQDNTLRAELMIGKAVPSYILFTGKTPKLIAGMSYEHKNSDNSIEWKSILNNPTTGLGLFYSNYGSKLQGSSISLIPFIEFHPIKNHKWSTKFGVGIAFFDTKYDPIDNPENNTVSSDLTWAVQSFLYYDAYLKNNINLRFGLGVFHQSNGHTKLPNEGVNTALLSVSSRFVLKNKSLINKSTQIFDKTKVKKISNHFYELRYGYGIQAFISEESKKKSVYSFSVKGGTFYKNIVKLNFGMNYRFYQHYYDYILAENIYPYIENAKKNASNINVYVGAEVLLGYIGVDWEIGANLYKPFYKKHYELQKSKSQKQYNLKKIVISRLGLKLYAFNTKQKTKNNIYIATHINSNFGQADFTELSVGFVHNIYNNKY